jgi:hypothetical protein
MDKMGWQGADQLLFKVQGKSYQMEGPLSCVILLVAWDKTYYFLMLQVTMKS